MCYVQKVTIKHSEKGYKSKIKKKKINTNEVQYKLSGEIQAKPHL